MKIVTYRIVLILVYFLEIVTSYSILSRCSNALWLRRTKSILCSSPTTNEMEEKLGLTENLRKYVQTIRAITDDRLKYQQLLYYAGTADPMPPQYKTPENKVIGCLSTVHVHCNMKEDGKVYFYGDSDSILTKGLVTILVKGLSGYQVEDILKVNPEFIGYAGFSLTSGRNNGFLNMLLHIKKQVKQLSENRKLTIATKEANAATPSLELKSTLAGPIQEKMEKKLKMLKPIQLEIENESHKHAGHAGVQGKADTGESHFKVKVIAECFEGVTLVNRHKLIYTLLAEEMKDSIHALSIEAQTPKEIASSSK